VPNRGQKSDILALAAAFFIASFQHSFGRELPVDSGRSASALTTASAGTHGIEYLDVAANCDVVICSYVSKTIICHRVPHSCPYSPSPRSFHLRQRKSCPSGLFPPLRGCS
jgi:hypothetical protein